MTTLPVGSGDPLPPLHASLLLFTGCVGESVPDICSYGLTIGETYVPFDPDPEEDCGEDTAICSQIWVRVTDINPTNITDGMAGSSCSMSLAIGLEVGIIRCIEIPEGGEAPEASEVMVAALQTMDDMQALLCAAVNCEVDAWDEITVGAWTPIGPEGGQYGGMWTFTVEMP